MQQTEASQPCGVHLRPVTESDLSILFKHQREPEANRIAAFSARERAAFMAHWAKILGDRALVAMAVLVDNCVAGNIGCWTQDGQRLIGYWIGQEYWGQGVATKMLSIFLHHITDRPLYAHVAKHNVASIRVLEKCGFKFCAKATNAIGEAVDGIEEMVFSIDTTSVEASASRVPLPIARVAKTEEVSLLRFLWVERQHRSAFAPSV